MRIALLVSALLAALTANARNGTEAVMIEYDINGSFEERLFGWENTQNSDVISDSDGFGQSRKTADRVGAQDRRYFVALTADHMDKKDRKYKSSMHYPLRGIRAGDTIVVTGYVRSDLPIGQRGVIGIHPYEGRFFPGIKINEEWGDHSVHRTVSNQWEFLSNATHIPKDFELEDVSVQLHAISQESGARVFFDNIQVTVYRPKR